MRSLITLLVVASGVVVLNAQQNSSARLAIRTGLVEVQRGNIWLPITLGDFLRPGESVRTAAGSTAAISVGNDGVVALNERSQIQIGQSNVAPVVQLESGSMKVFSTEEMLVAVKDTVLEAAERPLDMELGYTADKLNLTVFSGAVRNGAMTIRGGVQDPRVRTLNANSRSAQRNGAAVPNPTLYVYPYFLYGSPIPNDGRIVPPVVTNQTNPGYRPTQIVPPMSDPLRVPVTKP